MENKKGRVVIVKIQACFFDVDGTILNTLTTITHYGNAALTHFGYPGLTQEDYRRCVGNGARVLIERLMRADSIPAGKFDAIYEYYMAAYDADPAYLTEPFDGIGSILTDLRHRGVFLSVLSNKPQYATEQSVCRYFGNVFDEIHGGRDGVPLKPSPDVLLDMIARRGLFPDACVMIGDSDVDIKTAANAGVHSCGVEWGFRSRAELLSAGAEYLAGTAEELRHFLLAD